MKKTILFLTTGLAIALLFAFKQTDGNESKEFITIFYGTTSKEFNVSSSNGTFKELEHKKQRRIGDQSQILTVISEYETQGYKLIQYSYVSGAESSGNSGSYALMAK